MLRVDPAAIGMAVFNRLKLDSQGTAFRALLGAGANSVIGADALNKDSLPVAPFTALRAGTISTIATINNALVFTWYFYDTPEFYHSRINGLLLPLARAYDALRLTATNAPISKVEVEAVGAEDYDSTLGRYVRAARVIVYT
jgi:hypothetical protein